MFLVQYTSMNSRSLLDTSSNHVTRKLKSEFNIDFFFFYLKIYFCNINFIIKNYIRYTQARYTRKVTSQKVFKCSKAFIIVYNIIRMAGFWLIFELHVKNNSQNYPCLSNCFFYSFLRQKAFCQLEGRCGRQQIVKNSGNICIKNSGNICIKNSGNICIKKNLNIE